MEKNVVRKSTVKSKGKKESKFKSIVKNYLNFYNTNLRKKQIVIYIILLVLFGIFVTNIISQIDVTQTVSNEAQAAEQKPIFDMLQQKVLFTILIIIAGITPFVYIPVLAALFIPYIYSNDIIDIIYNAGGTASIVSASISSVLQFIGISLAVATGMYYCKNATKRFRYSQGRSFGMFDLKKQMYEIRKDDVKLEKLLEQRQIKIEKEEKLNVKIEYFNMLISGVISVVIVSLAALISLI